MGKTQGNKTVFKYGKLLYEAYAKYELIKFHCDTPLKFPWRRPIKHMLRSVLQRFSAHCRPLLAKQSPPIAERTQRYTILINKIIDGWYNRYSEKTVAKVGPQMACAYWLLRCAAEFRIKGSKEFISTKARLKSLQPGFLIEEIDLTDSCVSGPGFKHLRLLDSIKIVHCVHCGWVNDDGLATLMFNLQSSLETIEIINCGSISGAGLVQLQHLKKVKRIRLHNLPLVRDEEKKIVLDVLRIRLGGSCDVSYPDPT
uniref:ATP synthase subunit s, mitochondrial n=1 Tax=Trichuris muris TaxID=70415 RepID=A0A5S6QXL1_TRIMR